MELNAKAEFRAFRTDSANPVDDELIHIIDNKGETTLCGHYSAWGSVIESGRKSELTSYRLKTGRSISGEFCSSCVKSAKKAGWVEEPTKRELIGGASITDIES